MFRFAAVRTTPLRAPIPVLRRLAHTVVVLMLLGGTACSGGTSDTGVTAPPPPPAGPAAVASVEVTPATASLTVGATSQLSAVTKDANGNVLSGRTIVWASTSTAIATVSTTGVVTAVAPGTTSISATSEGRSGSATITVTPTASVTIAPVASVLAGLATQLSATVRNASGAVDPAATVAWRSSDTTRAVVDASGLLVARTAGPVTISAQSGTITGSLALTIAGAPDQTACRLPRLPNTVNFGFPRSTARLKTTGTVRMTVIFVDYPDAPATRTPQSVFSLMSPGAEERFRAFSYGKMAVTFAPKLQWLRMSKASTDYGFRSLTFELHRAYLQEAVNLAAPSTDFSQTDAVVVISNPDATAIGFGPAFTPNGVGSGLSVQGREILNGTNSGADFLNWGGANWLLHEIGHTLSLPDLYDYAPGTGSAHKHVGEFSQMGLISGRAPEWTGFERWQLGWLDDAQVMCAPAGNALVPLAPLVGPGAQKLLLIPISASRAIAVESRRARGYDERITQPGLLVYLLDTSVQSGRGTMRVLPENDTDASKLLRTLTAGQSLTHLGVTVTFVSSAGEQELVRVQR